MFAPGMQHANELTSLTVAPSLPERGLTSTEAEQQFRQFGPNDPTPARKHSALRELLFLFLNPLAVILLIAAVLSAFVGQKVDATLIVLIIVVSAAINFYQTYRSQIAIERLRASVASTATVLRDGTWQELDRRRIIPEDLVRLSAGDLVPADAVLITSRDLYVQQAALTGESLPTEKEVGAAQVSTSAEARNMVFLGTSVVSGIATARVVATGPRTAFGDVASRLATQPEETAVDRGLRRFGFLITRTVVFLVLFLVTVSIALHHNALESLLFAVALAVGLTPEFLPMITSVTLAKGAVVMAHKKVIVKHLSAIQNLGSIDVLCSDKTGTLTTGQMVLHSSIDLFGNPSDRVLTLAHSNAEFETGIRSPLDTAILQCKCSDANGYTKLDEIPFDFERRRLSVVLERQGTRLLITKGAPDGMFSLLVAYEANGQIQPVDSAIRDRLKQTYKSLSHEGFRVLAVAYSKVPTKNSYSIADECELIFAGFLTFADPPLPDAAETIAALKNDGIEVKILSGDNDLVAAHVCTQVGLDAGEIVNGTDVEHMTDAALAHVAEHTAVFARVSPAQKNRIMRALKSRSHVVGFMGDGINDAPSLHAADVGISAPTAVDVARDSADVILLEPGLNVLHDGILEGRKAFGNVMKYLLMGTSSNFGNMLSMAVVSIFLPFLPMLPTQILLNNFLYDMSQITIPTDNVEAAYTRKPQHWNISLIRNFMIFVGPISSIYDFLTFFVLLRLLHAGEAEFHTGWFVESLATQTLVLFVIRTMENPLRSRPSKPLLITILGAVCIALVLPFSPVAQVFGFTSLPPSYFVFLMIATATYLLLVQAAKHWLMPQKKSETVLTLAFPDLHRSAGAP
jgi:Mg2+-importing ATPase